MGVDRRLSSLYQRVHSERIPLRGTCRCSVENNLFCTMSITQTRFSLALATVILLGLAVPAPAQAQEASAESDPSVQAEGAGYFAIGTNITELGPLNDRLSNAGYPTFSSEMLSIGGGGFGVAAERLLLGGEGYGLITSDAGYQGRNVSVDGGYGLFTLGYLLRPHENLRVFPQVGLGGGGLSVEIGSTGVDDFDDVLDDPNRSATLEQGSLLLSLGAGVNYQFHPPGESGGLRVGLRAGYVLSPYTSSWQIDESTLSNGPDASLAGPFVRLTIGGGDVDTGDDEDNND